MREKKDINIEIGGKMCIRDRKYIGDETVVSIDSREKLRQELQGRASGGVYMTTIQKFTEDLEMCIRDRGRTWSRP